MTDKKSFPFFSLFASGAACVLVLFPLRIYQYFELLEPDTGFYSHKDFSVYLLYAVFAFCAVFSFVMSVINKKNLKNKKINLVPTTGAIIFGLTGMGFLFDVAVKVSRFFEIYNGYSKGSLYEYLSKQGGVLLLLESGLALISATYFFSLAGGSASRKDVAPSLKFIALAAPLWSISRLLIRFKTTISFINVSDLFIELFAIVFTMLFLLYFAQTMSQVDKGASYWKMYAYGIPASVFSLTCFVPRFVLTLMGKADLISSGYDVELCDLVIPVMIIATLISRSYSKKSN